MLGTPANRRLRSLAALLTGGGGGPRSAATAAEQQPLELTGVRTQWQPGGDKQGFGPRAPGQPPRFGSTELAGALQFFRENGFCVIAEALSAAELAFLNGFCERTQTEKPAAWQITEGRASWKGGIYLQPLLDHGPELEPYLRHPSTFPLVDDILGRRARFAQFDFRETPALSGFTRMGFHHDRAEPDRFLRPAGTLPIDYLCTIHYLTDVDQSSPAFAVVPRSDRSETLEDAKRALAGYEETPIYAPAGSCVFYDISIYHTRLDGDGVGSRRTMQHYFSRGGWRGEQGERKAAGPCSPLTDWVLLPKSLAEHSDPLLRVYYSHRNMNMNEWAASGFDEELRATGLFGGPAADSMGKRSQ